MPIGRLLPHGPEMTLIDRLVWTSDEASIASVYISESALFLNEGFVPSYVGIEYMAQTIAARVGFEARRANKEPPIGFLLGTRSYRCSLNGFPLGSRLEVRVEPVFMDAGFGAFNCRITLDEPVAEAVLNTYRPGPEMMRHLSRGAI
jgi:predicted hotdog family 3-hydroxylacyl-ACP dehydratase